MSTRYEQKRPALGAADYAEAVALVARAKRRALLHAQRHWLRLEDLEECLSQATLELVSGAPARVSFTSSTQIAGALEQRFVSRVLDRRRAVSGRSPTQTVLEDALKLGWIGEPLCSAVADPRAGTEELVLLRHELAVLTRLACALTPDQRLVLASRVALQMSSSEFCAIHGWTLAKYRKVDQRARARLRRLRASGEECEQECPVGVGSSDEEIGRHL